jgi:hypothetical protein
MRVFRLFKASYKRKEAGIMEVTNERLSTLMSTLGCVLAGFWDGRDFWVEDRLRSKQTFGW